MKTNKFKLLSCFLATVIVFCSIPFTANSIDVTLDEEIKAETINFEECRILDYIDESEFLAANHQQRLPHKEELNSYVFKNLDGTETAYFMQDNVKYYDESGVVKEKNLTLEKNANGYAPISNDISVSFPNDITKGISVVFGNINISVSPLDEAFDEPKLSTDGKAVLYSATKNDSLFLMYTPTLTGFKEDIILSKYYGVSSFRFRVETNGMGVYTEENGRVFVATNEKSSDKAYFGDIVVNDSENNMFFGNMTVTTLDEKQEYLLTISVNEDILLDESIVYPVKIDPSITINSSNNPKTIYDTNMYSAPYGGTTTYLILGDAGADVQSFSLMAFPGVYDSYLYSGISKDSILSANLYLYCSHFRATVYPRMSAMPFTGDFWSDNQSITTTANQGGDTNYTRTTVMGTVNSYNVMDITEIVKYWKGSYDAARKGLLLYLTDPRDYAFYPSSDNSDSSKKPYLTIQYSTVNQGYRYEFHDEVPIAFKNKSSSKVIQSYSNSLYQYSEDKSNVTQQFKLKKFYGGRYAIENNNGEFLTASDTETLTFYTPPPAGPGAYNDQLWYVVKTEDGYYQIISHANQDYCLSATSSSNGALVLTTNRTSDLSKWSIEFRKNVLRVFVHTNNIGIPGATVELFKADEDGAFDSTTTNDGGYAFFDNLFTTVTNYGITASKDNYERKSYLPGGEQKPVSFSGGGNGSGSYDASISISNFASFPLLQYPLSTVCIPPLLSLNQQFGWRNNNSSLVFHQGIDISRIPSGDSYQTFGSLSASARPDVVSISDGLVVDIHDSNSTSAGRYVTVVYDLNDNETYDIQVRYLHLQSIADGISEDQPIDRGQVIGKPGGSGNGRDLGYGVHLHIDITDLSNPTGGAVAKVDPNGFFKQR